MSESASTDGLKPRESQTIAGEWRSGKDAQEEFEATSMKGAEVGRTSLDQPTPVAIQKRRITLLSRFLQPFLKKSNADQVTELSQ